MDQESIATGSYVMLWASWVAQTVKNLPAMQETIPGLGRSPGEGHGNPLQYSCWENSMDRGWQAGYSPRSCKELDMTEQLTHMYFTTLIPQSFLFSTPILQIQLSY